MKISFKANIKLSFETKKKLKKNSKKNDTKVITFLKWISSITVEYLFIEYILKELVALIIKIITNGSFYFYNRFFYFEVKYECN